MNDYDEIIQALNQRGWIVTDRAVPLASWTALLAKARELWKAGRFQASEIGQGTNGRQPGIRGDAICWVQPGSALAQREFFLWMARLRQVLNERFNMGLRNQEFHFARYPEGKGYQKHIDQHRGRNFRKISIVLYLNPAWDAADGGELCLYQPYQPDVEMQRFAPMGGRLAVFVSGMIPHAVLPCKKTRWSVAGWLRTDEPSA
jgi:SM-20-related protein